MKYEKKIEYEIVHNLLKKKLKSRTYKYWFDDQKIKV